MQRYKHCICKTLREYQKY